MDFNILKLTRSDFARHYPTTPTAGVYRFSGDMSLHLNEYDREDEYERLHPETMTDYTTCWLCVDDIKEALKFCAGKNEVRYYLQGILIEPDGTLVATNGRVLHSKKLDSERAWLDRSMLLPTNALRLLVKQYKKGAKITFNVSPSGCVQVPFDNGVLQFGLIDAKFPDWRRILPEREGTLITIEPDVLKALKSYLSDIKTMDRLAGRKPEYYVATVTSNPSAIKFQDSFEGNITSEHYIKPHSFNVNLDYLLMFWDGKSKLTIEPNSSFTSLLINGCGVSMPIR